MHWFERTRSWTWVAWVSRTSKPASWRSGAVGRGCLAEAGPVSELAGLVKTLVKFLFFEQSVLPVP